MILEKNQLINFVTDHGQKLSGYIVDYNEHAIQVRNDIGFHVISHSQIIVPKYTTKNRAYDFTEEDLQVGWYD